MENKYTKECYQRFLQTNIFFEEKARSIVKGFALWKGYSPFLDKAEFEENEVILYYYYPVDDYENVEVTLPLDVFLWEDNDKIVGYVNDKKEAERLVEVKAREDEQRKFDEAAFNRLKEKLGYA